MQQFPTDDGQRLLLRLNGKIASVNFFLSEIESCADGRAGKDQASSNQKMIRQGSRKMLKNERIPELEPENENILARHQQRLLE